MKKILAAILSCSMIFTFSTGVALAKEPEPANEIENDEDTTTTTQISNAIENGIFPELPVSGMALIQNINEPEFEDEIPEEAEPEEYGISTYSLSDYTDEHGRYEGYDVYELNDAATYCIDLMKDHKVSADSQFLIAVDYKLSDLDGTSPYVYAYNSFTDAYNQAFNDSLFGTGHGGDYLLFSMYGKPFYITRYCTDFVNGNYGTALVWATSGKCTYYTSTLEENTYKAEALDTLTTFTGLSRMSDYEKVCTIFDYICDNVKYGFGATGETGYGPYTAWAALCEKEAVCQGYSNLFYYLCNEAGVKCRTIAGTAFNGVESGNHAWNIVYITDENTGEGAWYNVDVTWGASYSQWYKGRYFFLEGSDNFDVNDNGLTHTANYMNGIYYVDYTSDEFKDEYPISTTDYCNHNWSLDKTVEPIDDYDDAIDGYNIYVCSICGETYEEILHAHTFEIDVAPDCATETDGEEHCINCGYEQTIPWEHTWETIEPAIAKTCTKDGQKALIECSVCGAIDEDNDGSTIKKGHNIQHMPYVAATKYEDGNREYWVCSDCGTCFSDANGWHVIDFESIVLTYDESTDNSGSGSDGSGNNGSGTDGSGSDSGTSSNTGDNGNTGDNNGGTSNPNSGSGNNGNTTDGTGGIPDDNTTNPDDETPNDDSNNIKWLTEELATIINEAKNNLEEIQYSPESWENLQNAIYEAEVILENYETDDNIDEDALQTAYDNLESAINDLVPIEDALLDLINTAQDFIDSDEAYNYTETSLAVLQNAIYDAEEILTAWQEGDEDITYDDLQNAYADLEDAIINLELVESEDPEETEDDDDATVIFASTSDSDDEIEDEYLDSNTGLTQQQQQEISDTANSSTGSAGKEDTTDYGKEGGEITGDVTDTTPTDVQSQGAHTGDNLYQQYWIYITIICATAALAIVFITRYRIRTKK